MSPYEWIFLEWDQKSTNKQKYIYTNDGKEAITNAWLIDFDFFFYSTRAYFTQMPVSNFKTHLYALQLYPCSFYYRKERIDAIGPSSRERKSPFARVKDTTRALARFLQNLSIEAPDHPLQTQRNLSSGDLYKLYNQIFSKYYMQKISL